MEKRLHGEGITPKGTIWKEIITQCEKLSFEISFILEGTTLKMTRVTSKIKLI